MTHTPSRKLKLAVSTSLQGKERAPISDDAAMQLMGHPRCSLDRRTVRSDCALPHSTARDSGNSEQASVPSERRTSEVAPVAHGITADGPECNCDWRFCGR